MNDKQIRIAILGCGAVAELAHLPAIAAVPGCRATVLIDSNRARLESLAPRFNVSRVGADWTAYADEFDAAIVALPHTLHEKACTELLRAGKAVLVEKPMATTLAEAERMIAVADETQGLLAVGLMRRYQWSNRLIKDLITGGALGPILRFDVREGYVYNWPVASDFFFRKEAAGGGVLMDTGAHTLDTLLWWIGEADRVDYRDDEAGGVEADCLLELRARGTTGTVELSRTRRLRNTAIIEGERGTIEVPIGSNAFKLRTGGPSHRLTGNVEVSVNDSGKTQGYSDLIVEQLRNWVAAIRGHEALVVTARDALASIRLIDTCYRTKQQWLQPWDDVPVVETT